MIKFREKIFRHRVTSESVRLGVLLATIGGFLDAYTYIGEGGVFANAQTGNLVIFGVSIAKGNFFEAVLSLLPIVAFIIGVWVSEYIRNNWTTGFLGFWENNILIIEGVILFIIGFLPKEISSAFVTISISFVSSIQISSFRKLIDLPFSTTMCTGNLRSASQWLYMYFINRDKANKEKAIRYYTIILFFIIGALIGGILTIKFQRKSIWIVDLLIILAIIQFKIDKYVFEKYGDNSGYKDEF
ncbi:MAG: DUF1275 domain-containing protein [Clostridiales bacterium]|nr:DUF1275 domain-containing protein [Clostridiales bacterium]